MTITAADAEQLATRYAALQEQIGVLTEQADAIKAALRALGPGRHQAGAFTVVVQPNRRIDTARVEKELPATAHPGLYKQVVDTAAVKRMVSPAFYESLMTEVGEPKVSVK